MGSHLVFSLSKRPFQRLMTFSVALGAVAFLSSCGKGLEEAQLPSSEILNTSGDIVYWKQGQGIPLRYNMLDNGLQIDANLKSDLDAAWNEARELMRIKFREFREEAPTIPLQLESVVLEEKDRLTVLADGSIRVAKSSNSQKTGSQQNSDGGAEFTADFQGVGSEFVMTATFLKKSAAHGGSREELAYRLQLPVSYWKTQINGKAGADLNMALMAGMVAKLPPTFAQGLGYLLKDLGSVQFHATIQRQTAWFPETRKTQVSSGYPGGRTSPLALRIAHDVFRKLCLDMGKSSQDCTPKYNERGEVDVSEEARKYSLMKVVHCEARGVRRNGVPLYDLYAIAPIPSSTKLEFLLPASHLSTYFDHSRTGVFERKARGLGTYGTFIQESSKCPKFMLKAGERCIRVEYGEHLWGNKCEEIGKTYTPQNSDMAFSVFESKRLSSAGR